MKYYFNLEQDQKLEDRLLKVYQEYLEEVGKNNKGLNF